MGSRASLSYYWLSRPFAFHGSKATRGNSLLVAMSTRICKSSANSSTSIQLTLALTMLHSACSFFMHCLWQSLGTILFYGRTYLLMMMHLRQRWQLNADGFFKFARKLWEIKHN